MKKFTRIYTAIMLFSILSIISTANAACTKYTIDGNLASDWGVDLTQDWSQETTWLPNSGVRFIIEDNYDPRYTSISPSGVHIKGVGSSYSAFEEPKVDHINGYPVAEPYGGEYYDIEAMYFDQDSDCIYVAVILGLSPQASVAGYAPGDLALNLDGSLSTGEYGYEYGVKLGENTGDPSLIQFGIYHLPDWFEPVFIPSNAPGFMLYGTKIGDASGIYTDLGIDDNSKTNYVVELAIPKSAIGDPGSVSMNDLYLSEGCGNDSVPLPEFALIAGAIVLLTTPAFAYLVVKKKNKITK